MILFAILDMLQIVCLFALAVFGVPIPRSVSTVPLGASIGTAFEYREWRWAAVLVTFAVCFAPLFDIVLGILLVHAAGKPTFPHSDSLVTASEKNAPLEEAVGEALLSKQESTQCLKHQVANEDRVERDEKADIAQPTGSGEGNSTEGEPHDPDPKESETIALLLEQREDVALLLKHIQNFEHYLEGRGSDNSQLNNDNPQFDNDGLSPGNEEPRITSAQASETMHSRHSEQERHDANGSVEYHVPHNKHESLSDSNQTIPRNLADLFSTTERITDHQGHSALESNKKVRDPELLDRKIDSDTSNEPGIFQKCTTEERSVEFYLHRLQVLAASKSADFEQVLSLYCDIEERMRSSTLVDTSLVNTSSKIWWKTHCAREKWESNDPDIFDKDDFGESDDEFSIYSPTDVAIVRSAFRSTRLIYIPTSRTWLTSLQCTWRGANLRYSTSIRKLYGGSPRTASLFRRALQIPDFAKRHLLEEWDNLTPNLSRLELRAIFLAWAELFTRASWQTKKDIVEELGDRKLFPVSDTKRPSRPFDSLQSYPQDVSQSRWYIASTPTYEECFRGRVPLLDFDGAFTAKLRSIFSEIDMQYGTDIYLSRHDLTYDYIPHGEQMLHTKYSAYLQGKFHFVSRLINPAIYKASQVAASFAHVKVHAVESLSVVVKLLHAGDFIKGNPTSCAAGYNMSDTETKLDVYLLGEHLRDSYFKFQFELADILENICRTKTEFAGLMYLALTERNEGHVEEQFRRRGVPEITPAMEPEYVSLNADKECILEGGPGPFSAKGRKRRRRRAKKGEPEIDLLGEERHSAAQIHCPAKVEDTVSHPPNEDWLDQTPEDATAHLRVQDKSDELLESETVNEWDCLPFRSP